jgi:hypothetical protein
MYVLIQTVDRKEFVERTFPHAYDVLVYQEGGHYYAKDRNGNVICTDSPSACIQEAVDFVSAFGGGKVLIGSGIFKIDYTIRPKSNITISGFGNNTVLLKTTNIDPNPDLRYRVFYGNGVSNVVIEDLVVDGNKDNLPWSGTALDYHAVRFDNSTNIDIRNIVVRYVKAGAGIVIYKSRKVKIIGNRIHDNGSQADNLPSDAIYVGHSTDVIVAHNIVENVTDTGTACDNDNDVIIIGNRYINTLSNGITWYNIDNDPPLANRAVIMGNIIQGAVRGIWLDVSPNSGAPFAENAWIVSNIILNTAIGIEIAGSKNVFVEGNYIDTTSYAAIHTNNPYPTNIRIKNNVVVNGSVFGIGNEGNVSDIEIVGNVLINNRYQIVPLLGIIRDNVGFPTRNSGVAKFSGDGTTTQFKIAHGLVSTPGKVVATPASADAARNFYVTADSTYIYINYTTAPPSGTDNVVLYWYAEV